LICAKKYAHKFVDKKKLSETMKQLVKEGIVKIPTWHGKKTAKELISRACRICGSTFKIKPYLTRKTCSKKCFCKLMSENNRNNPNCGGELHYRRFIYNNVSMDSSWEVRLAKWMDDRKIKWERDRKKHLLWWTDSDGNRRRYYPDFYLPDFNIYLDPKNKWKVPIDRPKMEAAIKENNVIIIWGHIDSVIEQLNSKLYGRLTC